MNKDCEWEKWSGFFVCWSWIPKSDWSRKATSDAVNTHYAIIAYEKTMGQIMHNIG